MSNTFDIPLISKKSLYKLCIANACIVGASSLIAYANTGGNTAIVSSFYALAPIITSILGLVIYRIKLSFVQRILIIISLIATAYVIYRK